MPAIISHFRLFYNAERNRREVKFRMPGPRPLHPYDSLPQEAFWKSSVSARSPFDLTGLYKKKFSIAETDRIATAGSCFAQHIARNLRRNGYNVLDLEPAPPGFPDPERERFGYGVYAARYGNIYTSRQLLQLAQEAYGEREPEHFCWEKSGRFYDALRPSVEPHGLSSARSVAEHRKVHLEAVRGVFEEMDVFVFTLGLTETWRHISSGTVYPSAPGIIAGKFDENVFEFVNLDYMDIINDMRSFFALMKKVRHDRALRAILTVSPVPLTATASGAHVLTATTYSKATLRAVCAADLGSGVEVDYFPSYEVISSSWSRGMYYSPNLRTVSPEGVAAAMKLFFDAHGTAIAEPHGPVLRKLLAINEAGSEIAQLPVSSKSEREDLEADVQCEEALLEEFAR